MVLERIRSLVLPRVTLDFDGSVQSTKRRAEGTAVGFNKEKKGARSYYPLFCTLAQTGQVLDFLHRILSITTVAAVRRKVCSANSRPDKMRTQCHMDYIPLRKRCGNETYLLATLFAYNLLRDL